MRTRKKGTLVYTTSNDKNKISIAQRNCAKTHGTKFMMSVFGVKREITKDEYIRLHKAGYKVDIEI